MPETEKRKRRVSAGIAALAASSFVMSAGALVLAGVAVGNSGEVSNAERSPSVTIEYVREMLQNEGARVIQVEPETGEALAILIEDPRFSGRISEAEPPEEGDAEGTGAEG